MALVNKKQVNRKHSGFVRVTGVSANGPNVVVTAALTSALLTAGFAATAVPLSNSGNEDTQGLIVSGSNRVELFSNTTKNGIYYQNNRVYGRITYSLSVYTITFYTLVAGVETAYNTGGVIVLDFLIPYRFLFKTYPTDALINIFQTYFPGNPSSVAQGTLKKEAITVTAPNTLATLTYTPTAGTFVTLFVNGKTEMNTGATASFSVSGTTITWSAANAGYALATTDTVFSEYQTLS